jgi:pantoate--beta-alanine ligase
VSKLFHIVQPDEAFFGEKDFQQLKIVDRMAKDLNFPVKVVGCPTVREDDGLAMSSRNQYLTPEERKVAAALPRALLAARRRCEEEGVRNAHVLKEAVRKDLTRAGHVIDYVEVVREDDLEPVDVVEGACRLLAAVHIGRTRLIDNVPLRPGGKE